MGHGCSWASAAVRARLPPAAPATPCPVARRWQTADNPRGEWRNVVSDDSLVLHYAYAYESDVAVKAHRSCPEAYLEAARRGDRAKASGRRWPALSCWHLWRPCCPCPPSPHGLPTRL